MKDATQLQLRLFDEPPSSVEELLARKEDQWFERKSFRVGAGDLANVLIGLANADGGRVAVGIYGGEIEGVSSDPKQLNALLQASIDFTSPPVRCRADFLDCVNKSGHADRLLVFDVESAERHIHRNRKGECFLRMGDENRKLNQIEERELTFDKHESVFDGTLIEGYTREDLDTPTIEAYAQRVGSTDLGRFMRSRGLYYDLPNRSGVTHAGILLFGRITPVWSYVRYLRYSGTRIETGPRSNLTEDKRLDGTIPEIIEQTKLLLADRLGTVIRLSRSGRFEEMPALPHFAWLEAVVNAVTHRSYSLQGDGIRVRDFSDRLEIESPGRLPGLVRVQNIRHSRFSRNPNIARVLAEMTQYVRETNEGVERIFQEMDSSGLRPPVYTVSESSVRVTLYKDPERSVSPEEVEEVYGRLAPLRGRMGGDRLSLLLETLRERKEMSSREVSFLLDASIPTVRSYLRDLEALGLVAFRAQSRTAPNAVWAVTDAPFWTVIRKSA